MGQGILSPIGSAFAGSGSGGVGSGRVVVFRDGKRIDGTWKRPRAKDGTDLVDQHGKPITLAPGGAWFVLVNTGTPLAG